MMVSDTQKPYRRYLKHHYKKIILLFLIFLLVFITYDTIAVDKTKDPIWNISGTIMYHGPSPSQPVSIAIVLDSGEIIDKVNADENGFFTFTMQNTLEETVSFLVWVNGETYRAEDESGIDIDLDLSISSDQYLMMYVDNTGNSPQDEDEPVDDSDESDIPSDDDEESSDENDSPTNDSSSSSDPSDEPDKNTDNDDNSSDSSQDDNEDSADNNTETPGQSDNATSDDQNTTTDPSQNTTDPSEGPRINHNISLNKTIWVEEALSWEGQRYLDIDDPVLYNITIQNNDTENLSNITVIDYLPIGVTFTNTTDSILNYQQSYDSVNHTITWNITTLEANTTIFLEYTCITISSGMQTNMVSLNATGNGGLYYERNASADLFVFGSVLVDKQVWDSTSMTWTGHLITTEDSILRMNITIIYQGGFTLHNVSCTDTFSNHMMFLGNETINGVSSSFSYNETEHRFIWNTSEIEPDEPVYLEFDVKVENQSIHVNAVTITGVESIGKNFTSSSEVLVETVPKDQVYINKQGGYSLDFLDESLNATVNDTIYFSVDIRNIGNATIFNMTLKDYLPSSMEYIKNSAVFIFQNTSFQENPDIDDDTNVLTWFRVQTIIEDHIGPYEHCQLIFKVKLLAVGSFVNSVNFSYGRYDGETTVESFSLDNSSILVTDHLRPLTVSLNIPDDGFVDKSVGFQAEVSGGLSPYSYLWDFDDGINSTDPSPVHVYSSPGWYTVSLKVTDSNNTTASSSQMIYIGEKDVNPPVINLSVPQRWIYVKGKGIIPFFTTLVFGSIDIQGMVTDNESEVELIQVYIDNVEVASFDQSPFTWSWEKRAYGRHEIRIVAFDVQGNVDMIRSIIWKFF